VLGGRRIRAALLSYNMADFKLKCPDCNLRLRRVRTVDWHLEIKHIKWLYSCRRCGKGWIYYALKNQLTPKVPNGSSVDKNEPGGQNIHQ
jgi:hypothetical protein